MKVKQTIKLKKSLLFKNVISVFLMVFFIITHGMYAQEKNSITGIVSSLEDNTPLAGVNIIVKGTQVGSVSDFDGVYNVKAKQGDVLVFTFLGYKTEEVTVGTQTQINVSLKEDIASLDAVVVVGYGTQRKSDLTGSLASVSSKDFEKQPVTRIDQALQGRATGVEVSTSSGAPGGTVKIRVRGSNSITGSNEPLYVVDGFVGADFRDVNPSDIASIEVLKDASATAIYGSRGSNGVILISTKKGSNNKPSIEVYSRNSFSSAIGTQSLLNAGDFASVANQRASALGGSPVFTNSEVEGFKANGGTDWQDLVLRDAYSNETGLSYSGGNEDARYFVSGNFLKQEGVIINSGFKRLSVRANLSSNLSKKLSTRLNLGLIRRENRNTGSGNGRNSSIGQAIAWAPTTPARDTNGNLTESDPVGSIFPNPLALALNQEYNFNINNVLLNGGFKYDIIEGLAADVSFGVNYANYQQKSFDNGTQGVTAVRGSTDDYRIQNTNMLSYNKTFNEVHSIGVTAAFEIQKRKIDGFDTNVSGLTFPDLKYNNLTLVENTLSNAIITEETLMSYIGRVNYSFKDKYLVTASVRRDGSSKFSKANRFSTFPSLALSWKLEEENFIKNLNFFDNLKLRLSWGKTGNQAIGAFATRSLISSGSFFSTSFDGTTLSPGIVLGNPGNKDIKWETTTQKNIGLDFSVLDRRLNVSLDYYQKETSDLLLSEPLPAFTGGGTIIRNVGEVKNTGFEISLNSNIVQTDNFNWDATLNLSSTKNEVVSLGGDREEIFVDPNIGGGLTSSPEFIVKPGESLNSFYGFNYLGVWKTSEAAQAAVYGNVPGDSKFEDLNGDNLITADDLKVIGNALPDFTLGFNNTFNYKDFTLNMFWQGAYGVQRWNFSRAVSSLGSADARQITHTDVLNRWVSGTNENSNFPAFSATDFPTVQSSRFVEKADFLRLRNISLGYSIKDLIGSELSLAIAASNLITFTNYSGVDPEGYSAEDQSGDGGLGIDYGSYPNTKTVTLEVRIKF